MDDTLRAQRDFALRQLEGLTRRGRQLIEALAASPDDASSLAAVRAWQQASAAAIHQLSGGSKAHWLSRAFSGALLVRSPEGGAVVEANVGEIVDRILDILEQAGASLSRMDDVALASSTESPARRRFEFVHDVELRPILEQALTDSRGALERGDPRLALILSCGVLEAIITDALQAHARRKPSRYEESAGLREGAESAGFRKAKALAEPNDPQIADWPFDERIAAAEREGLIRGSCARLPAVARMYRDLTAADGQLRPDVSVSERDARVTTQVLHVVMRDLDPGR
jgi:hypothetical protein